MTDYRHKPARTEKHWSQHSAGAAALLGLFTHFGRRPMDKCPICLEDLDAASPVLSCGHRFHESCLGQLADANGSTATRRGTAIACPSCRQKSRVLCAPTPGAAYGVGDEIYALWGHHWFPGVVDEVLDGGYEIAWDEEDASNEVPAAHVRARAPVQPTPALTVTTTGDVLTAVATPRKAHEAQPANEAHVETCMETSALAPASAPNPPEVPVARFRRRCGGVGRSSPDEASAVLRGDGRIVLLCCARAAAACKTSEGSRLISMCTDPIVDIDILATEGWAAMTPAARCKMDFWARACELADDHDEVTVLCLQQCYEEFGNLRIACRNAVAKCRRLEAKSWDKARRTSGTMGSRVHRCGAS